MDWSTYLYKINESLKYPLLKIQNYEFSIWSSFLFIIIILISRIIAVRTSRLVTTSYFSSNNIDTGRQDSIRKIVRYSIYTIGLLIALQTIGIDISALLAGGAILAVGIGFGIQNIVTNFVAGLLILFERPIKKGDFIEIGKDIFGIVTDIAIRNTTLKTLDNVTILIPNSKFITENITNLTYRDTNIKIKMPYSVPITSNVDNVKKILLDTAKKNREILQTPEPNVLLDVNSNLTFYLMVWINNPSIYNDVKSSLNFQIVNELQKNEIYK
jgi:small-conductance mechanosensitive channel